MKRLVQSLRWLGFTIFVALPVASAMLASKSAGAQREPTMRNSVRPNLDSMGKVPPKIAPLLPWVSEYQQPVVYAKWWGEIAACEKLVLPVELTKIVHFVQINSDTFTRGQKPEWLYGYTQPEAMTIYFAQSVVNEYETVAHEMVHMLDYWNGVDAGIDYHPPDQFENCLLHTVHR